jgi:DNA-binding transcriptional regulator PaaX
MTRKGTIQKKVMLLLLAGVALSFTRSGKKHLRIIKDVRDEWKKIDDRALKAAIKSLYVSKLISQKSNKDGMTTFELSKEGTHIALTYDIDNMKILQHPWDKKWRIVTFDIPEKIKKVREALRFHLKNLGFKELHRSVFIFPYECQNEIEYIVEFYNARRFIRYIEAHYVDNELDLKQKFNLL